MIMGVIPILLFIYSNKPSWRFYFIEVFAVRFYHPNMRYYYDSSLSQMTPLARRHPGFPRKYHRKVVTVLKAAAHGNLANHQPTMFEQILRMANPRRRYWLIVIPVWLRNCWRKTRSLHRSRSQNVSSSNACSWLPANAVISLSSSVSLEVAGSVSVA